MDYPQRTRELEMLVLGACMANEAVRASVEPEHFPTQTVQSAVAGMKRGDSDQRFLQEVLLRLGVEWKQGNGKAIDSAVMRLKRDTAAHESVGVLLEAIKRYHGSSADGTLTDLFDSIRHAAEKVEDVT